MTPVHGSFLRWLWHYRLNDHGIGSRRGDNDGRIVLT